MKLAKNVIDKRIDIIEEYKDDHRSYVAKIKFENKNYMLKIIVNEYKKPLKKIKTIYKKGEALSTFLNINKLLNEGLKELYKPYIAIEKRKNGMISQSYLVTEYIEGRVIRNYKEFTIKEKIKIVKVLEKMHEKGVYHGDANHGNFIFQDNEVKIIDTQGKKDTFTFKRNYDFITLNDCIKGIYQIHKFNFLDPFYWLAYFLKKYKKGFRQ